MELAGKTVIIWNLHMTLVYDTNIYGLSLSITEKWIFTFFDQKSGKFENQFWLSYMSHDQKYILQHLVE